MTRVAKHPAKHPAKRAAKRAAVGRPRTPPGVHPTVSPALTSPFELANGRTLPPLLFATNRAALAHRIGHETTDAVLTAIRAAGHIVCDTLPAGATSPTRAIAAVRRQLARHPHVAGVVLLGGYEVVPAERLDCLPPRLRARVGSGGDPDDFIVWSDDAYGDVDGDRIPDLPVSRIPDGRSAALVVAALGASAISAARSRRGIRNVARPFADAIFETLPGQGSMLRSSPTRHDQNPPFSLDAAFVYLALHGLPHNGTGFWGEEGHRHPKAVVSANVPSRRGVIAFTGCCYGALTVDGPANLIATGIAPATRPPSESVALSFLERGARAFVGCTGLHYSPVQPPYDYFGAPLHEAFWRAVKHGSPPAKALLQAKHHFIRGMPHGQDENSVSEAIEFKTFREFTCLGLGW